MRNSTNNFNVFLMFSTVGLDAKLVEASGGIFLIFYEFQ